MHAEGIKQMGSFQVDIQAWRKSKKRRNDTEVLLSSSSDTDLGELGGRELLPSARICLLQVCRELCPSGHLGSIQLSSQTAFLDYLVSRSLAAPMSSLSQTFPCFIVSIMLFPT